MHTIEAEWDDVLQTLKRLTPALGAVGVRVRELEVRLSDFNIYTVIDTQHWLDQLTENLDEYQKVYDRHPADTWTMYETMGILPQLREGELLLNIRRIIRAAWRGRPTILKQTKRKKTNEGSEV